MSDELLSKIFVRNRKCVINTDLDGLLSGMFLQQFLNWEIVGFSSCCGKQTDDLWLKNPTSDITDFVFVDLPVADEKIAVIDQHFVAYDENSIARFQNHANKINPNLMRSRVFAGNDYKNKYPFGTAHFVLATLERLNFFPPHVTINLQQSHGNYDLADLLLRADRVIGNTCSYTRNCFDWSDWMIGYGCALSQTLFEIVKSEYRVRHGKERFVEEKLQSFGCAGSDGDCANLFRQSDTRRLHEYFTFLSNAFGMKPLPLFDFFNYGNLYGERIAIENRAPKEISDLINRENLFSYAFVSTKALSVTYQKRSEHES